MEAEFTLLSEAEAAENPAGIGRSAPNPLETPIRPDTSFLWFLKPFQTFRYIIWKTYWKQICLGIFFVLLMAMFFLIAVQLPSTVINKLLLG